MGAEIGKVLALQDPITNQQVETGQSQEQALIDQELIGFLKSLLCDDGTLPTRVFDPQVQTELFESFPTLVQHFEKIGISRGLSSNNRCSDCLNYEGYSLHLYWGNPAKLELTCECFARAQDDSGIH